MISDIALGLLLPLRAKGLAKLIKIGCILTFIVAVLGSHSRGGYLGLVIAFVSYLFFTSGKRVGFTVAAMLLISYVGYLQLPSDILGRMDTIINYQQDYNLTAEDGRVEIWKRGLKIVAAHPIVGVGMANFPIAEGQTHADIPGTPWMNAHNIFLQVAAEIGLGGLLLYLVLIARMFAKIQVLKNDLELDGVHDLGMGLFIALLCYLVTGFFLSQGFSVVFYSLMAMTLSVDRIAEYLKKGKDNHVIHT